MSESLHQRILEDIKAPILSGEWPPGHRIPFEHELTEQYQCSRMTVHRALSQLAEAGLITRRRRAGSFVTQPTSQAAVLEINDIKTEVEALGLPYRYELDARCSRRSVSADRRRLGLRDSRAMLELTCRHFAGARPFCLEERLINLTAVPAAAETDFSEMSPGPWLLTCVPWSEAEHRIRATGADTETAMSLAIPAGAPCLVIERRTWSAGEPITYVRLTYVGDRHTVVARFSPA